MTAHDWPKEPAGTSVAATMLNRIDAVSLLIDEGKYWKASEALYGERWLDGLDLSAVPPGPRKGAQQWINAAHDVLRSGDVDRELVESLLLEARRALAR